MKNQDRAYTTQADARRMSGSQTPANPPTTGPTMIESGQTVSVRMVPHAPHDEKAIAAIDATAARKRAVVASDPPTQTIEETLWRVTVSPGDAGLWPEAKPELEERTLRPDPT